MLLTRSEWISTFSNIWWCKQSKIFLFLFAIVLCQVFYSSKRPMKVLHIRNLLRNSVFQQNDKFIVRVYSVHFKRKCKFFMNQHISRIETTQIYADNAITETKQYTILNTMKQREKNAFFLLFVLHYTVLECDAFSYLYVPFTGCLLLLPRWWCLHLYRFISLLFFSFLLVSPLLLLLHIHECNVHFCSVHVHVCYASHNV